MCPAIRYFHVSAPLIVTAALCLGPAVSAAEEPLVPLNTLGKDKYRGFVGGLYAEGRNEPSAAQADALRRMSQRVQPLDRDGKPDPRGKIVLAGIGASVCKQIFAELEKPAAERAGLNPAVVIVNCAVGGQDVKKIADSSDRYWKQAEKSLEARGVAPAQVQVVWYQSDDLRDSRDDFPGRPQRLKDQFVQQLRLLKQHYPNVRVCYFSARHTTAFMVEAGAKAKHGEPRPYHNGWAVKWLIEDQSSGRADLRFEGEKAAVPLTAWATYFWTDGDKPRSDGYRWQRDDVVHDGVHLSETGRPRVANELWTLFATDPFAKGWFGNANAQTPPGAPPPKPTSDSVPAKGEQAAPEKPAWIVNGKDKMPKLRRLLGTTDNVRVIVRDLNGKQVADIRDICHRHTDLNELIGPGEYRVEFLDKDGKPIKLTQEVGEVLRLK